MLKKAGLQCVWNLNYYVNGSTGCVFLIIGLNICGSLNPLAAESQFLGAQTMGTAWSTLLVGGAETTSVKNDSRNVIKAPCFC